MDIRLGMKRCGLLGAVLLMLSASARAMDSINFDWRFAQGNHAEAVNPGFDDSNWASVDLPHDWAISGPFDPNGDPDTAMLPWKGEGWYRKHFTLSSKDKGKRLQFVFDGVMANPTVYLNGKEVGSWIYGYNSFVVDATDAAKFGGENVLTVHADTRQHASRWYPGAGIYRKVSMRLVNPVHIPVWGVYVTTPSVEDAQVSVHAEIEVVNQTSKKLRLTVETQIVDPGGNAVSTQYVKMGASLMPGTKTLPLDFVVENPLRWDTDHPYLYTLKTRIFVEGKLADENEATFGIRTFEWTADDGFYLNGRKLDLRGVCEHHTDGMLGAAFFPRATERKLEILRDMGVNAWRTSHNPPAPEILELCDRLGIVVIDELFDKWDATAGVRVKTAEYVNEYAEREVKNFVRRDRNHPSVMLWSVANEDGAVLSNRDRHSADHVAKVVGFFKQYDDTRPFIMVGHVPSGADWNKHIFDALDGSGWNYSARYANFRRNYPEKPIVYSETASAFGTRGYYDLTLPKSPTDYGAGPYQNNFGLTAATWSDIPEYEFERMRKDSFLNGNFVWTGFDYLGEPTPARGKGGAELKAAARSSYFGIIDLAGLPKDAFYLYRSLWQEAEHTVHVTPHWNWEKGDKVPVIIYTDGDEAELFLNGKSLGRKAKLDPDHIQADNLAFGHTATATTAEVKQDSGGNVIGDHTADKANDSNPNTRWCAENGTFPQEWEVDLGEEREFSSISIQWESAASGYHYELFGSNDGKKWFKLSGGQYKTAGKASVITFESQSARHLRVCVLGNSAGRWASISEFEVLNGEGRAQDPYFDIVDAYRIRFFDVPYEPGELKAVAYKDGKQIGESSVKTAGAAAELELSADRTELSADGMDLCYVTISMRDADGTLCPRAMNELTFSVDGAAELMGVANGDPMGMDSFTDETHPLFFGQAVAVLRSKPGASGMATLKVRADSGAESMLQVNFK